MWFTNIHHSPMERHAHGPKWLAKQRPNCLSQPGLEAFCSSRILTMLVGWGLWWAGVARTDWDFSREWLEDLKVILLSRVTKSEPHQVQDVLFGDLTKAELNIFRVPEPQHAQHGLFSQVIVRKPSQSEDSLWIVLGAMLCPPCHWLCHHCVAVVCFCWMRNYFHSHKYSTNLKRHRFSN